MGTNSNVQIQQKVSFVHHKHVSHQQPSLSIAHASTYHTDFETKCSLITDERYAFILHDKHANIYILVCLK